MLCNKYLGYSTLHIGYYCSSINNNDDKKLETLIKSMELVIGDVIIDERYCAEESEDIYSYIVEKIYTMPDYPKWNDVPFKDKPKAKLIIAFNKFIHDKLNKRTK